MKLTLDYLLLQFKLGGLDSLHRKEMENISSSANLISQIHEQLSN